MSEEENGTRGMTQRELLLEQRGLLLNLDERFDILQRDVAVHISLPIHPGAAERLKLIEAEQIGTRGYVNKAIGALAALTFLVPIAVTLLLKVL